MILTTHFTIEMPVFATFRREAVMATGTAMKDPLSVSSIPSIL